MILLKFILNIFYFIQLINIISSKRIFGNKNRINRNLLTIHKNNMYQELNNCNDDVSNLFNGNAIILDTNNYCFAINKELIQNNVLLIDDMIKDNNGHITIPITEPQNIPKQSFIIFLDILCIIYNKDIIGDIKYNNNIWNLLNQFNINQNNIIILQELFEFLDFKKGIYILKNIYDNNNLNLDYNISNCLYDSYQSKEFHWIIFAKHSQNKDYQTLQKYYYCMTDYSFDIDLVKDTFTTGVFDRVDELFILYFLYSPLTFNSFDYISAIARNDYKYFDNDKQFQDFIINFKIKIQNININKTFIAASTMRFTQLTKSFLHLCSNQHAKIDDSLIWAS
jgi:hypothetical protein